MKLKIIDMRNNIIKYCLLLILGTCALYSCGTAKISDIQTITTTNTEAAQKKPYVLLISLDGFRWDYVERFKPPHLSAFIDKGVQAASFIPAFPSKTFPNHYSIATGMYPDKHGIIGNTFYDYEKDATYRVGDRKTVEDGTFYKGTPIWIQANNTGMVTASYFFVGSEANIQGLHPTYYYPYDGNTPNEARVDQVLEWLELPAKKRPHLITMYFSDMDTTGHRYGPNNDDELKKTLFDLDTVLGDLFERVNNTELPTQVIIVSDHGMLEVPMDKYISTAAVKNDAAYTTIDNGAILSLHLKDTDQTDAILKKLQEKKEHYSVYRTADAPYFETTPASKNWGTLQVIPDKGYYFSSARSIAAKKIATQNVFGHHGFDPKLKEMHGIFYAQGPAFKIGYTHPSIQNIHVFPLICKLLDLPIPKEIDGELDVIKGVLKPQ
jgi:predicted AlkP superfamily pyrophosphatase or phosphodiesterase